jgi:uncharacterized protein
MGLNKRGYLSAIEWNLQAKCPVMLFLMGARQVGKTTVSRLVADNYAQSLYLNWDIEKHRDWILSGQSFIEKIFPLKHAGPKPLVIFDELHKYKEWKNFLKGFYDLYKDHYAIIVTGSAHLNIFQKGGDSLMGRYTPYTIHPFSIAELHPHIGEKEEEDLIHSPFYLSEEDWQSLVDFGGFPAPFLHRNQRFYGQWKRNRHAQLFREDIRDLTQIHEVAQLALFAQLLKQQSGQILNRHSYAKKLRVSNVTISRWLETLKQFYYAFTLFPWTQNIPHSLMKEPKVYLSDWSLIEDPGARFETMVACHLKKAVDFWSESGQDECALYFLRDKQKREVDFLITRKEKPWILVEAKSSAQSVTSSLYYFQEHTKAPFALQITKDMPYIDENCFIAGKPLIVPARTALSQLF